MSRLSEISFEPLEPYDGKLSCTVLRGERGSNAPDLPDITHGPFSAKPLDITDESISIILLISFST